MRIGKAAIAVLAVMASFGLATWAVGVLVMPPITHDPIVRWAVAPSAGVAAAALTALWAYDYAKRREESAHTDTENRPGGGFGSAPSTFTQNIDARAPGSTARGAVFGDIADGPPAPRAAAPIVGPATPSRVNQNVTASAQGAVAEGVLFGNIIKQSPGAKPARPESQDTSAAPKPQR